MLYHHGNDAWKREMELYILIRNLTSARLGVWHQVSSVTYIFTLLIYKWMLFTAVLCSSYSFWTHLYIVWLHIFIIVTYFCVFLVLLDKCLHIHTTVHFWCLLVISLCPKYILIFIVIWVENQQVWSCHVKTDQSIAASMFMIVKQL